MITVTAIPGHGSDAEQQVSYTDVKVIGKGTFGIVYRAKLSATGEMVAIKKVFHNEKFKVCRLATTRPEVVNRAHILTLFITQPCSGHTRLLTYKVF